MSMYLCVDGRCRKAPEAAHCLASIGESESLFYSHLFWLAALQLNPGVRNQASLLGCHVAIAQVRWKQGTLFHSSSYLRSFGTRRRRLLPSHLSRNCKSTATGSGPPRTAAPGRECEFGMRPEAVGQPLPHRH